MGAQYRLGTWIGDWSLPSLAQPFASMPLVATLLDTATLALARSRSLAVMRTSMFPTLTTAPLLLAPTRRFLTATSLARLARASTISLAIFAITRTIIRIGSGP